MPGLLPDVDPDGLLEFSVVYTDRALNHMSKRFQQVMCDLSAGLKQANGAAAAVIVPGSGSVGMEAVARQFATGRKVLVLRNGWFSYRWSQILDMGGIAESSTVLKARIQGPGPQAPFAPAPIDEVVATIRRERPALVFAPHVETSAGLMLPGDYLRALASAVHEVDGLLVLDCIASGAIWVDMAAIGVDILVSAPQKGWSSTPCCGLVMLGERALARIEATTSTSFALDLRKWLQIMRAYEGGGHAYHATLPTDGLTQLRDVMQEAMTIGLEELRQAQVRLGAEVRALLEGRGIRSVAAPGFQAPCVVVSYTDRPDWQNARAFAAQGLQVAAGVPLACDEPEGFSSFRIGLFGLDKLTNVQRSVASLKGALDRMG